ncbi:MAG TPA: GAF domain-containing protein [Baekduia sp.]|uniref:GAF domain-containing protein n=1 Tax=Baekduia sp. TaxID=2600305 RepID=UPI002D789D79|nr:GAF domain-containing protein [Baekduia sp.]HET6509826.1 GAF domain-containing protein [Baekduia sp.]
MSDWTALPATGDRRRRALRLARAHDAVLAGAPPPPGVRGLIVDSWRRCAAAGIDPQRGLAPLAVPTDEASERWARSPLAAAEPVLRELLADVRAEGQQVVLVCDADGTLLWIDGDERMLDQATGVHLMRGARWSEAAAGTNAMGTALALDHSLQVFSAEHFATPVHGWTCSAAPLHDPRTGQLLGVLDLSGPLQTAHPHSLALVGAAARMVEAVLAQRPVILPASTQGVSLRVLGRDRAEVTLAGGRTVTLSRRHSELMVLLALRPDGMTAEEIAIALYGDFGKPVTARAELSRLRRILGGALLAEPYRLAAPPRADFLAVTATDVAAYPGPLLPRSEVPLVVEAREALDHRVRSAVLRSGDPALLERWVTCAAGRDDLEAARRLVGRLAPDDVRRPAALSHLRRLVRTA